MEIIEPLLPAVHEVIMPESIDPESGAIIPAQILQAAVAEETQAEREARVLAKVTPTLEADGYSYAAPVAAALLPDHSSESDWAETGAGVVKQPVDRAAYREAWAWDGASVVVDAAQKAAIRWQRARRIRNKLLRESDAEIMSAQERGQAAAVTAWKAYRQSLRDIPQTYAGNLDGVAWPARPA